MKGHRARYIAAAMTFLALTGVQGLADEALLRNPSFEDPKQQDNWFSDQAAHWERWGDWINRETSWQPTSEGECLIGYHYWKVQGDTSSGIYQDIPGAKCGVQYSFSVLVFKDPGANMDSIEVRLEPSGGGAPIASRTYRVRSLKSKEWVEVSVSGLPLADGIRVVLVVTPQRGRSRQGALKFDQAQLTTAGATSLPLAAASGPR